MTVSSQGAIECLLAEDDPTQVQFVEQALLSVPIPLHLHVVDNGDSALAFLQQQGIYVAVPRPDLVLLDLSLPQQRGEDVLAALKADSGLHTIPVFVALKFAEERSLVRARGLHPTGYVLKPVNTNRLLRMLHHKSLRQRISETLTASEEIRVRAGATIQWARELGYENKGIREVRRILVERKAEQPLSPGILSPPLSETRETLSPSGSPVDFLKMADFLRDQLQQFYFVVRSEQQTDVLLRAAERLQDVLSLCEPLVSDLHQREHLPLQQQWGFLQLLSFVMAARHALSDVRKMSPFSGAKL